MSTQILMPALSPTMEEGKLAKWHVKEGDAVKAGDILAEIETDKATMEFEAIDEGRIGKILVPEGAEGVKVNAPIAVLETDNGEAAPAKDIPSTMKAIRDALAPATAAPQPQPAKPAVAETPKAVSPPAQAEGPKKGNGAAAPYTETRVFASPLARRIAQQAGVDLAGLHGSGPRGRIVKADVESAAKGGAVKPAPRPQEQAAAPRQIQPAAETSAAPAGIVPLPDARLFFKEAEYDAVPNDSMRKTIARRLTSAKTLIPHYYLTIDCDIGALMQIRARLNDRAPKGEGAYKLSVNDFVIKAAAMALAKHPDVNASWTDAAILKHHHADIGIAVDLNPGLITPIVFRAETKGLIEISNETKALAERAKAKKLKPQEYEGGGFSISNLGMFGIRQFTALINPPQSAILAVGVGEERAVARDGKVVVANMMSLTMSCDHRVIDGATGSRFLQTLKIFIEEPASMLL
ncbi:MAG TPA: pyruvate dehydrogenase complex dihydrolipoamide acetyltransferase [Micropepsaceae bacterium]|nr:pyruvate dehydrogenase complex dihydrolipoamide acetyltransferase [Micropepsaceae bacterium]